MMAPPPAAFSSGTARRAQELAGQVDIDAPAPVGRTDLLYPASRAGNASIVHQHIQPTECRVCLVEQPINLPLI